MGITWLELLERDGPCPMIWASIDYNSFFRFRVTANARRVTLEITAKRTSTSVKAKPIRAKIMVSIMIHTDTPRVVFHLRLTKSVSEIWILYATMVTITTLLPHQENVRTHMDRSCVNVSQITLGSGASTFTMIVLITGVSMVSVYRSPLYLLRFIPVAALHSFHDNK